MRYAYGRWTNWPGAMGNNVKELRLAFLLTPTELAARMGADAGAVERLESGAQALTEEWVEAVARALGVSQAVVTDPEADIPRIVAGKGELPARKPRTCPIGARYAILAMIAKFGGLKMAQSLDEDEIARAVQNLVNYVEDGDEKLTDKQLLTRLSLSLQIICAAALHARGVVPDPGFSKSMETAQTGATSLVRSFSEIVSDPN